MIPRGSRDLFRESEEAVPQIVETTDEIGVREQRDILFLSFNQISEPTPLSDESWKNIPYRSMILQWLTGLLGKCAFTAPPEH